MTLQNTWHAEQKRTENNTFVPKWNRDTIVWMIEQIRQMVDFVDIQYQLAKEYKISLQNSALWVEMARRIMKDVDNGLTLDEAMERDQERRNVKRHKSKTSKKNSPEVVTA